MKILEVSRAADDDTFGLVFTEQERLFQERGWDVVRLSTAGTPLSGVPSRILGAIRQAQPDAILIRGATLVPPVLEIGAALPIVLDHYEPYELVRTSPVGRLIPRLRGVVCYSQKSENEVRRCGLGRVKALAGPFIPPLDCPLPERPAVGVLSTCSKSREALFEVLRVRRQKGMDFPVVSTLKGPDVTQVSSNAEVAAESSLLLASYEETDYGQPHEGAILALAFKRALATHYTQSLTICPYPQNTFVHIRPFTPGMFGTAFDVFTRSAPKLLEWPSKAQTDPYALITSIEKWVSK